MAKRYTSYFLGVLLSVAVTLALLQAEAAAPAVYIFGDSTLDVGTNVFIPECTAKADVYFNGIDFPNSVPTGRFSNGLNTADEIVRLLGWKRSPPPFLYLLNDPSTFKQKILRGANFASGGSGILNTTGRRFNKVISMEQQIQQFSTVRSNITNMTGSDAATDRILSKAFFLISIGSNDILEYLLNLTTTKMSIPEFNVTLLSTYENHLKTLYDLGARTFGILTVPPIGCTPFARAVFTQDGSCFEPAEQFAEAFTVEVAALLKQFSTAVQDIRYSLGNTYLMTTTMMEDMLAFGFRNVAAACCGNGTHQCNQTASFCANRDEYLFWDQFHPSQKASELAALTLFGASESLVAPMNFSQLLGVNVFCLFLSAFFEENESL
ncbi:GDSL esterase/lipase At5g33370-like [Herrania umbratica]|uniref:GDSL esterase/lipase At5g33370-like n=1 Tax=Herrania umbratica TaxID=108875 RepID=A0A6J0ZJJ6_9ROSI|nr:GDSL esterase/lipase At5g33370-like [Herrania umbratica]